MEHYAVSSKKNGLIEVEPYIDFENTLCIMGWDYCYGEEGAKFFVIDDEGEISECYELMMLCDGFAEEGDSDFIWCWVQMPWNNEKQMFIHPDVEWYDDETNGKYCMYVAF